MEQVRLQRRETVAAIEAVETWAREHREPGSGAYTDMVDLYLSSLNMNTVAELADMEVQAHAYLRQLQGEQ